MKNLLSSGFIAAALAFASAAPAHAALQSDPESDADCTISLMLLMAQAEEADQAGLFSVAIYHFGRLGGEGKANKEFLLSRMDRFVDDQEFFLEKSQQCAADFEAESNTLAEFGNSLAD